MIKPDPAKLDPFVRALLNLRIEEGGFLVSGSTEQKAREIGKQIDASFGFKSMQWVCDFLRQYDAEYPCVADELERAWHGIGIWRA